MYNPTKNKIMETPVVFCIFRRLDTVDLPLIKPDSLTPNRKYNQEFMEFFFIENDIFGDA
ncbi:MAG: hypothetical protein ACKPFK_22000 [Dolichospermum sp.]